ncbi:MAG: hypothetical protein AAGC74_00115 [Verrucomicrobiota bacterium]
MIEQLHNILNDLASRRQKQRLYLGLAITWWLGIILGVSLWQSGIKPEAFLLPLVGGVIAITAIVISWSCRGTQDHRTIAAQIEQKHPEMQTALLAALDQNPDAAGSLNFLQSRVILESLVSAERDQWLDTIPKQRLDKLLGLMIAGICIFFLTTGIISLSNLVKKSASTTHPNNEETVATPDAILEMNIEPGDVELERHSPLTIQVHFDENPPAEATLEITDPSGTRTISLSRPFTDPIFQTRLSSVSESMVYRVITPQGTSQFHQAEVYDLPALKSSLAVLNFSEHLNQPPKIIKNPAVIHAVEGTQMDLTLVANLPGLSASLVPQKGQAKPLRVSSDNPNNHHFTDTLTKSTRYEIVLKDSKGRRNSRKDVLEIKVKTNKPPIVKVDLPRKKDEVTPIQEVQLSVNIRDDSGILEHGLRYTLDGENWQEVPGSAKAGTKRSRLAHFIDLEAEQAQPNDVIMWNAWAEDLGPDGKKRRVNGDIHLIPVRNFDEQFYQRQGPPGEGSPCKKLIVLQTKILEATWNLRRDHSEITSTSPPQKELESLSDSQKIAIDMAKEMESNIKDPADRQLATDARLEMQSASEFLSNAVTEISTKPLDPAIAHEQVALRSLYQLQSSQTMINQSKGQSKPPIFKDDQIKDDLDLKSLESPYEHEKSAKPETAKEALEAMETLKRLRELAKRQRDLNEEMKSLQMAMNKAKTAEEKVELERRLKQLQEQQRELLADIDRIQERVADAAPEEQSERLSNARDKAQQANENLEKKKLGDALASGSRVQESLEQLHDEFRTTSAAKLAQQLRELREDARNLERNQRQLAHSSPNHSNQPKPNRLSDDSTPSSPDAERQQKDYQALVASLQETAETAEKAEPLVAKDLIEALRQANQKGIEEDLNKMKNWGDRRAARDAAENIAQLTSEIESAAERILGNEAQALRYARDELQRLTEMAQGQASESGKGSEGSQTNTSQPGQHQAGDPGEQTAQTQGKEQNPGNGQGQTKAEGKGQGTGKGQAQSEGNGSGHAQGQNQSKGQAQGPARGQRSGPGQQPGQTPGNTPGQGNQSHALGQGHGGSGFSGGSAIANEQYGEWRDRMSDLEAIMTAPEAQSAVSRARQASHEMRKNLKRHSIAPDESRILREVIQPLREAAKKIDAQLRELDHDDPLAPVGRDLVPEQYQEIVSQYFEELGKEEATQP